MTARRPAGFTLVEVMIALFVVALALPALLVITSYSIHYTKLYENAWKAVGATVAARANRSAPHASRRSGQSSSIAAEQIRNNFV